MHRILLILAFLFCVGCTNYQTLQQVTYEKKEYKITKRLPFITTACDLYPLFPTDHLKYRQIVSIWEDGKFRREFLYKEPFDAIEDLRIYQSNDYLWSLLLLPFFGKRECDQYHITGYLIYFDSESKQKWYTNIQKEKPKLQADLPMMVVRESHLMDSEILTQVKSEMDRNRVKTSYHQPKDPLFPIKVWSQKPNSEITALSDDRLIDTCLEFPYECVTDANYRQEIRRRSFAEHNQNTNPTSFSQTISAKIQSTDDKTYFGCYCRKNPDFSIYVSCPIDSYGLDSICKEKIDCFQKIIGLETTQNISQNQCMKKFKNDLSVLIKTKNSKDKIHQGKENFERMLFYTKKIWALEELKSSIR